MVLLLLLLLFLLSFSPGYLWKLLDTVAVDLLPPLEVFAHRLFRSLFLCRVKVRLLFPHAHDPPLASDTVPRLSPPPLSALLNGVVVVVVVVGLRLGSVLFLLRSLSLHSSPYFLLVVVSNLRPNYYQSPQC